MFLAAVFDPAAAMLLRVYTDILKAIKASPPPLTKSEYVRFASKHVDPKSIWHQAYPPALKKILGARVDSLNHNRPQKEGGPQCIKLCKHKLPSKGSAGTCGLDGLWTWKKQ